MVRSAASILQRTSSVIHSGRAETTRISSCQVSAIERLLDQFAERAGGQGPVEIAESALADGGEDARRVEIAGEDDLGSGLDGAYAA